MMFFRVVLCLAGLLLYLVVKEFSANETTIPAGHNALLPVPPIHADAGVNPPFPVLLEQAATVRTVSEPRTDGRLP